MSNATQSYYNEQDEQLEEIGNVVKRIKPMVNIIGDSIDTQKILLDEMGNKMNKTEEKMGKAMTKLSQLLKTTDKGQIKTFVILLIVSIVLFFVLIA